MTSGLGRGGKFSRYGTSELGGIRIARDQFNLVDRRGDKFRCVFVLELGAPGLAWPALARFTGGFRRRPGTASPGHDLSHGGSAGSPFGGSARLPSPLGRIPVAPGPRAVKHGLCAPLP
jgi:hypothetical protein